MIRLSNNQMKILETLDTHGGLAVWQLHELTGIPKVSCRTILYRMIDLELVFIMPRKSRLTNQGRSKQYIIYRAVPQEFRRGVKPYKKQPKQITCPVEKLHNHGKGSVFGSMVAQCL